MRGRPQADNPAQQGSKAGRDVQFTALGACFVGSVFVELAGALAQMVIQHALTDAVQIGACEGLPPLLTSQ